jgi:hypothetical protein
LKKKHKQKQAGAVAPVVSGGQTDPTATVAAETREDLDKGHTTWQRVLLLGWWETLTAPEDAEKREAGERLYQRAFETFKKENEGAEIVVFPAIRSGVSLLADGELRISVKTELTRFNISEASRLIFKIDALAEEAKEWLNECPPPSAAPTTAVPSDPAPPAVEPVPSPTAEPEGGEPDGSEKPGVLRRAWAFVTRSPDTDTAATLRPHSLRAYSLASGVIAAIQQENTNEHPQADGSSRPKPGSEFESRMADLELDLETARHRFKQAAQRIAQGRYWQGTMFGAILLGLLSAVVGLVFWWKGVDAAYGVALPAGGIGAMVSVLQRMSSGKLVLDIEAGRDLVEAFGAVRPFIGAIFGVAVMALLLGSLIPAIHIPEDRELAFFAGLGFLAGFNERWAQDMLRGSAEQVGGLGSGQRQKPAL